MFDEADPDDPGQFTKLGLCDDPEPALQRALRRAREETYLEGFSRLLGGIGLIVVLVLLSVVFNQLTVKRRPTPNVADCVRQSG